MKIPLVDKEEILPHIPKEKRVFAEMIKLLEKAPSEEDEFKLKLFGIFLKGITDAAYKYVAGVNEAIENFPGDKLSFTHVYEIGVHYSLNLMRETVPYILDMSTNDSFRQTLYYMYMEGIENATHAFVNGIDIEDTLKVVCQLNSILIDGENNAHSQLWKDVKISIFGEDYFRMTDGKIV